MHRRAVRDHRWIGDRGGASLRNFALLPLLPKQVTCDELGPSKFRRQNLCQRRHRLPQAVHICTPTLPSLSLSFGCHLRRAGRPKSRLKAAVTMTGVHAQWGAPRISEAPETSRCPARFSCPRRLWRRQAQADLGQPFFQVCKQVPICSAKQLRWTTSHCLISSS